MNARRRKRWTEAERDEAVRRLRITAGDVWAAMTPEEERWAIDRWGIEHVIAVYPQRLA